MNWVEKRYASEQTRLKYGSSAWTNVVDAMRNACASYNERFAKSGKDEVQFDAEGPAVTVRKVLRTQTTGSSSREDLVSIRLMYEQEPPSIRVSGAGPVSSRDFRIEVSEATAYIAHAGETMDPDRLSKLILEPLLFPSGRFGNAE